jgi:gliding motility-associated-like protein
VDYEWDIGADGIVEGYTRQFRYEVKPEMSGQTLLIRLRAKNANNCWAETTMTYTPLVTPVARFDVPRSSCLGEPAIFENRSQNTGSATYFWDFGDGNTSTEINPVHVYQDRGTYTIKLVVRDQNGCIDSTFRYDYHTVSRPIADFILNDNPNLSFPLRLYYPGDTRVKFADKSTYADSIVWEIIADEYGEVVINEREFEREYIYDDTLNPIRLIAYDARGCTSVVEKGPIYIIGLQIHIPNIFTPNGDGANDVFRIIYNGPKKYSLRIFDRWGMQVSNEITDYLVGWNGKDRNGNPCAEGVYYYVFKLDDMVLTGEITLTR